MKLMAYKGMETTQSQKAEDYLKFSKTLQTRDGFMLLENLDPKEGDFVLDLGCGTGNLSVVIAEKVGAKGRVVAIDPDQHRIAVARKTFGDTENIEFEEGSSETLLNLGKTYFDSVFMNYVLHWIKDKKHALKNIYEVLKAEGRIAMIFNPTILPIIDKALRDLNSENFTRLKQMYPFCEDIGKIESYCKEAGFIVTESAEVHYVMHQPLSTFLTWLSATYFGVFDLDLVNEEKLNKFKVYLDEEGFVSGKYPVGIIIAKKTQPTHT